MNFFFMRLLNHKYSSRILYFITENDFFSEGVSPWYIAELWKRSKRVRTPDAL